MKVCRAGSALLLLRACVEQRSGWVVRGYGIYRCRARGEIRQQAIWAMNCVWNFGRNGLMDGNRSCMTLDRMMLQLLSMCALGKFSISIHLLLFTHMQLFPLSLSFHHFELLSLSFSSFSLSVLVEDGRGRLLKRVADAGERMTGVGRWRMSIVRGGLVMDRLTTGSQIHEGRECVTARGCRRVVCWWE